MDQQNMKAPKAKNGFSKGAIIGGAVGLAAGGIGGYFIARKKLLKKCKADVKKAYDKGYRKGESDAEEAAKEVIDEINSSIIVADSDSIEDIQKAIEKHEQSKKKETNATVTEVPKVKAAQVLNDAYEETLNAPMAPEEIDNWDLSIDGEEAMKRSEERERYLDLVDKYQQHPEDAPMHISRKNFEEECYLDKDWVTYYAGDNVFASDHDADTEMDAFENFGVVNGNDLFTTRVIDDEDNDDPDIVYIRNFKKNTVYEVTRTKESYARLKSGEVYLENGESDPTA